MAKPRRVKSKMADPLITTEQAAAYMGISPLTLHAWRRQGIKSIPYYMVGDLIRYRRSDIDNYLERCKIEPGGPFGDR